MKSMQQNKRQGTRSTNKQAFCQGLRHGLPIGLGYFAVSFSLGIAARNAGLNALQGLLASLLNNASAGEYAGFTVIAAGAAYWEIVLITIVANARYLLMSASLSQKLAPGTPFYHRLLLGYDVTDEIFAISVARPGYLNPFYTYGAMAASMPCWAAGTTLGVIMGNLLPLRVVSALSVALYGMFLAVIVPPARKDKVIAAFIGIGFVSSFLCEVLPYIREISSGTRTILLTVLLSAAAAVFFPINASAKGEAADEP